MEKDRSFFVFEQAIRSEKTKHVYSYWLERFRKYTGSKNYDELLIGDIKDLQIRLEEYLFELKKIQSRSTIEASFYAIELFYSMNDVNLNFKKIRKMFPPLEKRAGQEAYTTEDIRKILDSSKSRKTKALIHLLAASGMRIGAVDYLKLKHIKPVKYDCRSVLVYAGDKEEYTTFLTPEAGKALDWYIEERKIMGEEITPESPVFVAFRNKTGLGKVEPLSYSAARTLIHRAVHQAHITNMIEKKRYAIPVAHGFRKRFNTILKSNNNINSNLVEKMMGHSTTIRLDNNYLKPSIDRLLEEYVKGISDLTISNEERQNMEIDRLNKKSSNLEIKNSQVLELAEWLDKNPKIVENLEYLGKIIQEKIGPFFENASSGTDYDKTLIADPETVKMIFK
ncbi:MAG: tyrosine-type recombinase/integrase [Nitrosopumilaceae archaeon]